MKRNVFGNISIKRCLTAEAQSLCFGVFLPIRGDISVSFPVKNIIRILLLTYVIDDRYDLLQSSHDSYIGPLISSFLIGSYK